MAYIQLCLYQIPAVVIHCNTLTMEEWSRWYTPYAFPVLSNMTKKEATGWWIPQPGAKRENGL